MTQAWKLGMTAATIVLAVACGSSKPTTTAGAGTGGGAGTGSGAGTSGGAGTSAACGSSKAPTSGSACATCLQAHCNAEASGCYGSGWASGTYSGGACSTFISCTMQCQCNDATCAQGCISSLNAACQSCSSNLSNCQTTSCGNECGSTSISGAGTGAAGTGGAGTGTAGIGGAAGTGAAAHTCAQLSACCGTLTGKAMMACTQAAQAMMDSLCSQVFTVLGCK